MTGRHGGGALACLQIVALLLLAPPTARAAITLGPTIDLPWSQVDFQGGTVAVLANGSFAITSTRIDLDAHQVQFFSGAGDLLPPSVLKPPVGSHEVTPYIGVGSLGRSYFLVWQDYRFSPLDGSPQAYAHAYAQLYSDKGTPLGAQFPWPSSAVPDFAEFYRFGSAPRWRFLPITYELLPYQCYNFPAYQVWLRAAEPDAILQLPPTRLGPPLASNVEDAAINGRGRFVVDSFQCTDQCPLSPCLRGMQLFDDAIRPITSFLTADVPQTNFRVFAAINGQGQVLLHYYTSSGRNVVRLYDENGSPASGEIPLRMSRLDESDVGEMKGLDDGSFALAWIDQTGSYPSYGSALVVARFDPQTRTFEKPVLIATSSYLFRNARLKLNGDGRGVVVWESQDVNFQFTGHFRSIDVRP